MNFLINQHLLSAQIAALRLGYPELEDDDDAWQISIESETDAPEMLARIERRRQEAATSAGALITYIAELESRLRRYERREQAMRDLAYRILQLANLRKVELPEATFSIVAGQPKVLILDEKAIPDALCRFTRTPDKTKVREWLKSGTEVPGAVLSNAEPHIMIRTR